MDESTDTSTTTPGTPTTNAELGVVSAQQAEAEAARASEAAGPTPPDDVTLRLYALQEANKVGGSPDEVVSRATTYATYLKDGKHDG